MSPHILDLFCCAGGAAAGYDAAGCGLVQEFCTFLMTRESR